MDEIGHSRMNLLSFKHYTRPILASGCTFGTCPLHARKQERKTCHRGAGWAVQAGISIGRSKATSKMRMRSHDMCGSGPAEGRRPCMKCAYTLEVDRPLVFDHVGVPPSRPSLSMCLPVYIAMDERACWSQSSGEEAKGMSRAMYRGFHSG